MYTLTNLMHQAQCYKDRVTDEIRYTRAALGWNPFGRRVLKREAGNRRIASLLREPRPLMVSRLGFTEPECVTCYLQHRKAGRPYADRVLRVMPKNTGLFPGTEAMLDRYSELYLDTVTRADVLGVNVVVHENLLCREVCTQAILIAMRGLEPYLSRTPWSAALAGRRVVVVYPFARTIERQYHDRRTRLFRNPDVLPEFRLRTVQAVQSLMGNETGFADWFEALAHMQREIAREDFDVAIIGAGAYGLPLAAYVKSLGKQAVHMAGATQLLFGIKGGRWEHYPPVARLLNDHWVRPSPEETPAWAPQVERGCYW